VKALWLLRTTDINIISVLGFARAGGTKDWLLQSLLDCNYCDSSKSRNNFYGFKAIPCGLSLSSKAANSGHVICHSLIP